MAETASINQSLPLGMSLTKVTDQSVNISAAVDEFMITRAKKAGNPKKK